MPAQKVALFFDRPLRGRSATSATAEFLGPSAHASIPESGPRLDPKFSTEPGELADIRICSPLSNRILKASHCGAKTFDGIVRIRRDFVRACSKSSSSASNVFEAGAESRFCHDPTE